MDKTYGWKLFRILLIGISIYHQKEKEVRREKKKMKERKNERGKKGFMGESYLGFYSLVKSSRASALYLRVYFATK